jgi:hypothetical protein
MATRFLHGIIFIEQLWKPLPTDQSCQILETKWSLGSVSHNKNIKIADSVWLK